MEHNNKYELVKYVDGEFELEINVSPKEETIWMTANQMALLFDKDEKTIRKHINNVFKDGELVYDNNTQKMRVVGVKQLIKMYSLNVIISVGYRVKSHMGVKFRIWANQILREYLLKGFVINENRVVVSNENFNNLLVVVNDMKSNQIDINTFNKQYGLLNIINTNKIHDIIANEFAL